MAVDFDAASSEYLTAASNFADLRCVNALGEASLSYWINTTQISASANDWESPHVTGREVVGNDDCMWGGIDNGGASISLAEMSWAQGVLRRLKSTEYVNDGAWHHVVQTMKLAGAVQQIYFDGVLDTSASGGTATSPSNTFTSIGRLTAATPVYLDGLVDDVRIYNRVLTATEVAIMYAQRGADPIIDGLVTRYKLDDGAPGTTVSTAEDEMGNNHVTSVGGTPTFEESYVGGARRRAA